jgi:oligosaccharide 4-alpha-D-glucosyltransferase
LLPYVYTLAYENSTTGMPLMRPLFFEDEDNLDLIDEKDAYLWGDAFLVAPVMDAGIQSVDVDLPAGTWFDFWDGTRYEGGKTASVPVTLRTIPVLVRAGSFVPMIGDIETTQDYSSENLTLHYYADASISEASGRMYDDDGKSRLSLENGLFEILEFESRQDGGSLALDLRRTGMPYPGRPGARKLTIVVHNWTSEVSEIRFADQSIDLKRRVPRRPAGAHYDAGNKRLTVRVEWDHAAATLQIN